MVSNNTDFNPNLYNTVIFIIKLRQILEYKRRKEKKCK